ncbi:hypothetical protein GGF31_002855 [Allomyces arbusculus]|nr:hypothetical protein GGF31_002855 [Allomyces arbusculus]
MNHLPGASSRPPPAAPARAMNHLSASRRMTGLDRRSRSAAAPPPPPPAAAATARAVPGPSSRTRAPPRSATYVPPPPPPASAVPAAPTRRLPVPAAPALSTARPVYHLSLDADKLPPGELDALAGKITRRGGDVEPFFSKNVTHLVVDDALKPLVAKLAATPAASLNSMRHRILKSALDLNAKIVTYSELRAQLFGNAPSASSSSKDPSKRPKSALRPLTGHYFVVLDSTGVHRPIMEKEYSPGFTAFPKLTVMPDSSQTPFLPPSRSTTTTSGDAATLDALLMDETDPDNPDTPRGIIGLVPAPPTRFSVRSLPASAPPLPPVLAARARVAADPNVTLQKELDFLHDVDALLASRAPLSPGSRAPLAPLGGAAHAGDRAAYCERCDGKFRGLDDHVRSDQHRKVVRRGEYWRRLDDLAARHARVRVPDGYEVRGAPLPRALHEAIYAAESDVPPTSDGVVPPSEDVYGEDGEEEEGPMGDGLAEEVDADVDDAMFQEVMDHLDASITAGAADDSADTAAAPTPTTAFPAYPGTNLRSLATDQFRGHATLTPATAMTAAATPGTVLTDRTNASRPSTATTSTAPPRSRASYPGASATSDATHFAIPTAPRPKSAHRPPRTAEPWDAPTPTPASRAAARLGAAPGTGPAENVPTALLPPTPAPTAPSANPSVAHRPLFAFSPHAIGFPALSQLGRPATATAGGAPTPFAAGPPTAIAPLTSMTSQFSFDMDSRPATMAPGGHSFKSPVLSTDVRGIKSDAMPSTMPLSTMPLDPSSPCVQAASHRRARQQQQQQLAIMRKQGVVGGGGGGGKQLFHTPVDSGPGFEDVSELSDLLTSPTPKRARLLTPNS